MVICCCHLDIFLSTRNIIYSQRNNKKYFKYALLSGMSLD